MGQKIDLSKHLKNGLDDMTAFTIIHAITAYEKAHRAVPEAIKPGVMDTVSVDVEFRINGVEMDFVEFMERIQTGHDEYINKRAVELIKEKFQASIDRIDKISTDAVAKFRQELGLPEEDR